MNKAFVRVMVILLSAGSLASCKIGKKPVHRKVIVDTTAVTAALVTDTANKAVGTDTIAAARPVMTPEKIALADSIHNVWQQKVNYTTLSGKAKMHYEGKGQSHDFIANIRIKKDSAIWVSITASILSVQVARVYITPDSIKLINYLQKEVILMPLSKASELLPASVDFAALQNLIAGNALRDGGTLTDVTGFGGAWSVQLEDSQYVQQLTYNKTDSTMRSGQLKTHKPGGPQMMIQYGNYETISAQHFADSRAINIVNGPDQYYIDMNFSNVVFNQPVELPFSIPKSYTTK